MFSFLYVFFLFGLGCFSKSNLSLFSDSHIMPWSNTMYGLVVIQPASATVLYACSFISIRSSFALLCMFRNYLVYVFFSG